MSYFKQLRKDFEAICLIIYGNDMSFDFDESRESYCYEKTRRAFDLYRIKHTENAQLKARIAELERINTQRMNQPPAVVTISGADKAFIRRLKADAIREAIKVGLANKNFPWHWSVVENSMLEYADDLERGEL